VTVSPLVYQICESMTSPSLNYTLSVLVVKVPNWLCFLRTRCGWHFYTLSVLVVKVPNWLCFLRTRCVAQMLSNGQCVEYLAVKKET